MSDTNRPTQDEVNRDLAASVSALYAIMLHKGLCTEAEFKEAKNRMICHIDQERAKALEEYAATPEGKDMDMEFWRDIFSKQG